MSNRPLSLSLTLVTMLFGCGTQVALATFPLAVASSQSRLATGMTAGTKVVIDPAGNLYTVSANGNLWEVPAGSTTATQIILPNNATLNTGGAVKIVGIGNTGSGYTTAPTVTFSAPKAGGTTATGTASLSNGVVQSITIVNAGSGYAFPGDVPTITLSAPPAGGIQATAYANITSYYGLGGPHGLAVDSQGDVIVQASYNYHIFFLPNISGKLNLTANAAGTGPLDLTGSYAFSNFTDYYAATSDIAVDTAGKVYISFSSCNNSGSNACGVSHDTILTVLTSGPSTTAATIAAPNNTQQFIGALPAGTGIYAQNMALDTLGHLFYADGANVWITSTTTPAPVKIGTFVKPYGVAVDAANNLYVSDNSNKLLYCIPNEGGTLNPAHQYIVAFATNLQYGVAFDAAGNFYSADGYTSGSINKTTLGALSLGSTAVGTASANGTATFWFNGSVTPSKISLLQGTGAATEFKSAGGTCAAGTTYTAGQSCTATVSLTAASTGIRSGAVELLSGTNTALGTAYLTGVGTGAALTVDPGTQTAPTALSAWVTPSAVALDAAGNSYVADSGANAVQVISAAGTATATLGGTTLGLSKPQGVAVDGAGNVYISDTGNNRIVMVPNEGGTLNPADLVGISASSPALKGPEGIAVDAFGAVYVADTGNQRVVRFSTFNGASSPVQTTVGTKATSTTPGYVTPTSVTTDNNGNIYVADADPTTDEVFQVNVMTGAQQVILKNLSQPTSVALDASGALYVVNNQSQSVSRVQIVNGVLNPNNPLILGTNLTNPTGVAVNGAGNVAISDSGAPGEFLLNRISGTLNFGNVNLGLSSSAQPVTLTDAGTASVTLGVTPYVATGTGIADYAVTSPGSGGCTGSQVLIVGGVCSYNAVLSPIVGSGTLTELMTFSSNASNAGTISELLTGIATNLSLTTTTLSLTSSPTPIYGQPVTVQATVVSQRAGYTPTGKVTFTLNGLPVAKGTVTLSTTSPYIATFTFPALTLQYGINSINAFYLGDSNNAGSTATSVVLVTVAKQPTATAVTVSTDPKLVGTQLTTLPGTTYYFNATVSPTIVGSPTGTVGLVLAGTTTPVLATAILTSGTAQLVYTTPTTAAYGNYSYQVIYLGDSNFGGSTVTGATITLSPTTYTVAIPATSYNVTVGQSVTVPVTITGLGGYAKSVTVGALNLVNNATTAGCTGLPANAVCTFSPGIVALTPANYPGVLDATGNPAAYPVNNPVYVMNIVLQTSAAPATYYPIPAGFLLWPGGLAGLLALTAATRRRGSLLRSRLIALAFVAALSGGMLTTSGCGTAATSRFPTPVGTSAITLTFSGQPLGTIPTDPVTGLPIPTPNIIQSLNFQLNVTAAIPQ